MQDGSPERVLNPVVAALAMCMSRKPAGGMLEIVETRSA